MADISGPELATGTLGIALGDNVVATAGVEDAFFGVKLPTLIGGNGFTVAGVVEADFVVVATLVVALGRFTPDEEILVGTVDVVVDGGSVRAAVVVVLARITTLPVPVRTRPLTESVIASV